MIKYDRLWKTLESRGISGNSFYKDYGVSKGQISRLKQNKYVSTHTLARICALLECDITDILEYEYDPSDLEGYQRKK